jgi:hypothetical protein
VGREGKTANNPAIYVGFSVVLFGPKGQPRVETGLSSVAPSASGLGPSRLRTGHQTNTNLLHPRTAGGRIDSCMEKSS